MSRPLLLLGLMSLACAPAGTSIVPEPAPTPAVAAPAPADPRSMLPPWARPLFDAGSLRRYDWDYAVDTHDEEGSIVEANGVLRCEADGPLRHELDDGQVALVSCLSCASELSEDGEMFEPTLDECFVATARGLWIVPSPPDRDETRELLATPPYLAASPEPRADTSSAEEDGFEYEVSLEITSHDTTVQGQRTTMWCRTDADTLMYGSSTRRCFAPELGMISVDIEGRSGPSTESYTLTETSAPAAR